MQKTVHINKVTETLDESEIVDQYDWINGDVHVWFSDGEVPKEFIGELVTWGMVPVRVNFVAGFIQFGQEGHVWD